MNREERSGQMRTYNPSHSDLSPYIHKWFEVSTMSYLFINPHKDISQVVYILQDK